MTQHGNIPSPLATGGAGTTFEQHVGAMFLALLLVRGIPAVFRDCQVDEVGFQTRYLGWETDDLLVDCSTEHGRRRLAIQVKRNFAVRSTFPDCVQTFERFWRDFKATELFDSNHDALVLVTLRGTNALMDGLGGLLECARNSSDEADFAHRLSKPGLISDKAKQHEQVIRSIVEGAESSTLVDREFWQFLKTVYLLNLDFTTSTALHESWVKSVLAQAATGEDAVRAAETTWHELIDIGAASASGARSLKRSDLPDSMRARHSAIGSPRSVLQTLQEHSDVTLDGIRSRIAGVVTLPRYRLRTQANEALAETQVIVLTGPPGSGKSALAKALVQWQANDHVSLSFRAEEFAESHIDRVLQGQATGRQLETLLAAQERVLLHVESLERLLEHPTRDAFSDLIRMAERCHNIRLLLTCRDYSLTTALTSFFGQSTLSREIIELPLLDDLELNEIVSSLPRLAIPLSNPRLKQLLRIPYFLDMAAPMNWTSEQDTPSDVSEFRQRCWSEVVRRDDLTTAGMPDRRERALVDLAIRRARELRPSVPVDGIEAQALDVLHKDGIISKDGHGLAAPAHDVIEDWAIVHWIESLAAKHDWQASPIADSVGGHPALRRGFREWLKETLERDTDRADQFVLSTYGDASLAQHFRDDVLTSVLLSHSARDFVSRQRSQLLANDANLLVRLIHLTRVACKTVPRWLDDQKTLPSAFLDPVGEAWPAVLQAVADGLDTLLPAYTGAVVELLDDWSRGASWIAPLPDGAVPAGKIAFRLLENLDSYGDNDLRKRVLKIITRVPRADEEGFMGLVSRALDRAHRHEPLTEDFAELLLHGIDGVHAGRDFPEHLARLTLSWCCLTDADLERIGFGFESLPYVEAEFGIPSDLHLDFFPASAIRGPFLYLLRQHPAVGVQLVLDLVNHAGHWYGERKWPAARLEPALPIAISVPGHGDIEQWANGRLWTAYRGNSGTPYIIDCALMALESWLLSHCEGADDPEPWLLQVLLGSNSVMTTAVVASVCNAHPEQSGAVALALLTSREAIMMDRARLARAQSSVVAMDFPSSDPMQKFYNDERKRSSGLVHRSDDLEALAWKLQFGGKAEQVWQIIDAHQAEIPDEGERTDEDRAWLLALHRMDVRNYEAEAGMPASADGVPVNETEETTTTSFVSKGIDAELQGFVDAGGDDRQQFLAATSLLAWGLQQWERRSDSGDTDSWRTVFTQAKEAQRAEAPAAPKWLANSGPGIVAAVCVRDHWEDLSIDDWQWSLDSLIADVERDSDNDDHTTHISIDSMDADRHGAYVLPKFLAYNPGDTKILKAVAKAITHETVQVSLWAAEGTSEYLMAEHKEMMLRCVGTIAMQANLLEKHREQGNYGDGPDIQHVRTQVRDAFVEGAIDAEKELAALNLATWQGRDVVPRVLSILGKVPDLALSKNFFTRAAQAVVASWTAERQGWSDGRDFEFEDDTMTRLATASLTLPCEEALLWCKPFLDAVEKYPKEVTVFVEFLILQEDLSPSHESCFWDLWKGFADRVVDAPWLPRVASDYSTGADLVSKILFRLSWKEGVRRWHHLGGHEQDVDDFMSRLPATASVLQAYSHYLYEIGEGALPKAFIVLANRLEVGNAADLLSDGNTIFFLESLIQRYVYGQPLRLRSDPTLREAVLVLLDQLVDAGSSAAYRMRDDFVTPTSHT